MASTTVAATANDAYAVRVTRRTSLPFQLLALLGVAAQFAPNTAAACSPCSCATPRGVRPHVDSIAHFPLNARFFVELTDFVPNEGATTLDRNDIRWVNIDTKESVSFEVVDTSGSASQVWLVPTAQLAPNSQFAIEVGPNENDPIFREQFRTGTNVDTSPPVISTPTVEFNNTADACGEFNGAVLTWNTIEDDDGPIKYDPVVELRVTQGAESIVLFQDTRLTGAGRSVQLAAPLDESSVDCWASSAIPFYSPGKRLTVTVSLYDRAGNWTQLGPLELSLRPQPGASCPNAEGDCSVTPLRTRNATNLGWLLLLGTLLAAANWRRRAV